MLQKYNVRRTSNISRYHICIVSKCTQNYIPKRAGFTLFSFLVVSLFFLLAMNELK